MSSYCTPWRLSGKVPKSAIICPLCKGEYMINENGRIRTCPKCRGHGVWIPHPPKCGFCKALDMYRAIEKHG